MQIESITVNYKERPEGSKSKLRTVPDGIKVLKTIGKLFMNYKPFAFFGIMAFILFIMSTAFFVPVVKSYICTGIVEKFPTLIVCMAVYMFSLLMVVTGIILQNLRRNELMDFEFKLNMVSGEK